VAAGWFGSSGAPVLRRVRDPSEFELVVLVGLPDVRQGLHVSWRHLRELRSPLFELRHRVVPALGLGDGCQELVSIAVARLEEFIAVVDLLVLLSVNAQRDVGLEGLH